MSDHPCSSSPISGLFGSVERVVFPVPLSPKKRAVGYFSDVVIDDIGETYTNGINNKKIRPPFITRDHYGTDLYILGFNKPENKQPWNVILQRVILNNYFIAIYDNKLRVILKDETKDIDYEINSSNIIEMMEIDYNNHKDNRIIPPNYPFLDAYINSEHKVFEEKIEGLGKCKLYVQLNKDYKKKVVYMRMPKMMVFSKPNPRLSAGYSALFICDNRVGNRLLSKCEDPKHSEWLPGWHSDEDKARKALSRITRFINASLESMIVETYSSATILSGLNQFTYSDESDMPGEKGSQENSEEKGDDGFELIDVSLAMNDLDYKMPKPSRKKKRKRKVKVEDGFDAGDEAGAGSGGPGENSGVGGDQAGAQGFGEEEGRQKGEWKMKKLPKSQFNYKCFQKSGSDDYTLVISSKSELSCQIRFYANGVDKKQNEDIILLEAFDAESNDSLNVANNIINNVETTPNPKTIKLVTKHKRKFGVEVELYA